jgi:hypothetical protein
LPGLVLLILARPLRSRGRKRAIDLRKLRDAQKPDFRKHTIPPDATDGSVHWIRFDGPVTGRLVVLQRHRGMASNYTCSTGCICQPNFQSLHVYPSSWDMLPGDTKLFTALEWRIDCNNFSFYLELSGGPWASAYPSVATVTPGGGLVTAGDTGGSTAIMLGPITRYVYNYVFHYPSWQCQANLIHPQCGGTVNVQNPSISVMRQSLTSTSASGSPSDRAGNPAFTYSATGSGNVASYTTQNANANPNTGSINAPANPGGAPTPGGLGTLTATYHLDTGATGAKSFQSPTFGLSCYIVALENDWINADGTCKPRTISGTTYSGYSTNPAGLPAGQYCNSFLGTVRLNGSGQTRNGTKIHWQSGNIPNWVFSVIQDFTGADGTLLIVNQTLARDRGIIPMTTPSTNVQLPAGTYAANDIGDPDVITGYRLDIYMGIGNSACSGFVNSIVVGACSPAVSTCPAYSVP